MQAEETNEFEEQVESNTAVLEDGSDTESTGNPFRAADLPPRSIEDFIAEGVDPCAATQAKPGTEDKVRMLAARYEAGLPLWNHDDCLDHGPQDGGGINLLALAPMASTDETETDGDDAVEENVDD